MTKTEARRQAARARRLYGMQREDGCTVSLACPIDADSRLYPPRPTHRVVVWHKPWEKVTAPMIDAAFVEHYCHEYPEERCASLPAVGASC